MSKALDISQGGRLSIRGALGYILDIGDDSRAWRIALFAACCLLLDAVLTRLVAVKNTGSDHYAYLARHLLTGSLTADGLPPGTVDTIAWNGHIYLPFGPLPAVILVPFLPLLDMGMPQACVSLLLTAVNIWLFSRILLQLAVAKGLSKWIVLLYFGGSIYLTSALLGTSWHLAHVVATTFLLLGISEVLGKRRPALIGLYLGLAGMARFTTLFSLPFFLWMLWRADDREPGVRRSNFAVGFGMLLVGLSGPVILLLAYNYLRFGSPLESGYGMAVLGSEVLVQARNHGLFSLVHIPKNLFMLLIQGPIPYPSANAPVLEFPYLSPSPWGMGIFITSPALVYAFRNKLSDTLVQACLLGIFCTLVPIVTYYGVGFVQFGFRYALDFLPFLMLLVAKGFPDPPTKGARALVLAGVVICLWGSAFAISIR